MLLGVGNEVGHAVDAAAPQPLVLVEQVAHDANPLEIGAHDFAAPDALLGDQAGAFEDGDVLLNRGEAHRVVAGQLDDALLGADGAADDVAPRLIGQRAEHAVEVCEGGRRNDAIIQPYGCILDDVSSACVAPAQKRPSCMVTPWTSAPGCAGSTPPW